MNPTPASGHELDNSDRLDVLNELGLLDSLPEASFDRYTRLAVAMLKSKVSLISLVDDERQFFVSQQGLEGPYKEARGTPLSHSFCQHVVREGVPLVVEDARTDERVRNNFAIRDLGVISYLGIPVTSKEGYVMGSLCAINPEPRKWSEQDLNILTDLADAVSTEIHIRQSELALKDALGLLREAEELREKSLKMLVHDLRTPAAAIISLTELLESPGPGPDHQQLVLACRESAQKLLDMIGELLEINTLRAEPGSQPPILAAPLLRHACRIVEPTLRDASLRIEIRSPEPGSTVSADPRQIERVLLNLLTNAIKFSPVGSTIVLAARQQRLGGVQGVRFEVEDAGPGVPEAEKDRIFEAGFTGSQDAQRGMPSFGIGLAFCKMVVDAHHGAIGVEDVPGGGSRFNFFLPS